MASRVRIMISGAPAPSARATKTSSYEVIYAVVRRIPRGRVCTYGGVARLAGRPGHARLVGYALHALPNGRPVPWHRVVNAAGRLSLRRSALGGELEQRFRLEREGVRFDGSGRIALDRFAWAPGRRPSRARKRT